MAGGEAKHSALRLAAGGEEGLVRLQQPPLGAGLEDLPEDSHLPSARRGERLLPAGADAPTVVMAVAVMSTGQIRVVGLPPHPQRCDRKAVLLAGFVSPLGHERRQEQEDWRHFHNDGLEVQLGRGAYLVKMICQAWFSSTFSIVSVAPLPFRSNFQPLARGIWSSLRIPSRSVPGISFTVMPVRGMFLS